MKQIAVEWLYNHLFPKQLDGFSDEEWNKIDLAFEQALEMEKEYKQKVNLLLYTLLENNMCSVVGDELIQTFKSE